MSERTDATELDLAAVREYLDTWGPYRGGRSLASHGGKHLFLRDLRALANEVERLLAALDEARAEVAEHDQHRILWAGWLSEAAQRAEAAESSLAAVRALADEWEVLASRMDPRSWSGIARQDCADEIRAALARTPPDENPATTERTADE